MRWPHTTGLECARPGIGVFQSTPDIFVASQFAGVLVPVAVPCAPAPRNCGQFCAWATERAKQRIRQTESNFIVCTSRILLAPSFSKSVEQKPSGDAFVADATNLGFHPVGVTCL